VINKPLKQFMELKNISYFVIITLNNYVKMSPTDKRLCKGIKYLSCLFSELLRSRIRSANRCQHPLQPSSTSSPSSNEGDERDIVANHFDRPRASFFAQFSTNHLSGSLLFKSLQFILKNISLKTKLILKLLIGRPYSLLNSRFG
jgi:hypothetical protein